MTAPASAFTRWTWYPAIHVVLFQLGWYACVRGAAAGDILSGPGVGLILIAVHLVAMRRPADELRLMGGAVMIGLVCDSLLGAAGLVRAVPGSDAIAPPWLLVLWALFACTLHTYCRWLLSRPLIASLCGLVGGPLCSLAAARIGALHFPAGSLAGLAAIALEWALVMPLLISWANRIDARHQQPPAAIGSGPHA